MGLIATSENGHRIYLGIVKGQIRRRSKDGQEDFYKSVEGTFKGIATRESEFNGAPVTYLDFSLQDGGDEFVVSVNRASSVARSIVLSLASAKSFAGTTIRIEPWLKSGDTGKEFTNISVYRSGEKLRWLTGELPEVKTVTVGSVTVKDDTKLTEFIQGLTEGINAIVSREAIAGNAQAAPRADDGLTDDLDDMPEGM